VSCLIVLNDTAREHHYSSIDIISVTLAIMDAARIADLLAPFLGDNSLSAHQLDQVSDYLDRLMRWNQRMNLTSVRDPEQIITRHFGESFFAAAQLLGREDVAGKSAIDIGSGAGFPGLPIKIFAPSLHVRLLEAQHRKATFLREVIRDLGLKGCEALAERAEVVAQAESGSADLVTLRAVEHFQDVLPVAAQLTSNKGRVGLLIGREQAPMASTGLPTFEWQAEVEVPLSASRIILIGRNR
jgi:16S rRNA (guanine527-N7)-methyltransferase